MLIRRPAPSGGRMSSLVIEAEDHSCERASEKVNKQYFRPLPPLTVSLSRRKRSREIVGFGVGMKVSSARMRAAATRPVPGSPELTTARNKNNLSREMIVGAP